MPQALHRAFIMGENIMSVTALHDGVQFTNWKANPLNQSANFDPEMQINVLRNEGYNVHVLYESERMHLISAIPQDSPITHPQWMMACADYLHFAK